MKLKNRLGVIFAVVFIDFLGLSFILPLYPELADRFGLSATMVALLAAAVLFWGRVRLGAHVDRFVEDDVWSVGLRHRFVLPQL